MAALTRHGFLANSLRNVPALFTSHTGTIRRGYAREAGRRSTASLGPTHRSTQASLASKGFLRSQKSYTPKNVTERFDKVCEEEGVSVRNDTPLTDGTLRFNLFIACGKEFDHYVPNSLLCSIETIRDLRKFYETPIDTTMPLDAMSRIQLPKNLHIQYEYHRFNPETDTMFGGKTAFPKSSTIVTGLKYKKKYRGYVAKTSWP